MNDFIFACLDWMPNEEDASDKNVWDDTWDQGEIEENEFTQQLRLATDSF